MAEMMQRMLGDLAQAKLLPDADLQFIIELETQIITKARQPLDAMQQAGVTQAGGGMGMGMQGGGMPQMQPPMPGPPPMPPMPPGAMPGGGQNPSMPPPGGVPGVMSNPSAPSADELQRLLAG
jgi:hypothetical protein